MINIDKNGLKCVQYIVYYIRFEFFIDTREKEQTGEELWDKCKFIMHLWVHLAATCYGYIARTCLMALYAGRFRWASTRAEKHSFTHTLSLWLLYNIFNQAQSEYKHLLSFHVRSGYVVITMKPVHWLQIRPIVHNYGAPPTTPQSYIWVHARAVVWACGRGQTQTDRQHDHYTFRVLRLMRNACDQLLHFLWSIATSLHSCHVWQSFPITSLQIC